jgi:hypothetical protein
MRTASKSKPNQKLCPTTLAQKEQKGIREIRLLRLLQAWFVSAFKYKKPVIAKRNLVRLKSIK